MGQIHLEQIDSKYGGTIAVIRFDNPETRNSLTPSMGLEFRETIRKLSLMSPLPRALILTGANGVFSSGGDYNILKTSPLRSEEENRQNMIDFYSLFLSIRELPVPVIAAVNGHAVGASLSLVMACDIRYFVPDAKHSFNFVRIGIHPGMGSSWLVKEVGGMRNAQELLLTGRYFNGEEALRRGLCHAVYPEDQIFERALDMANEIAQAAPAAVRYTKMGLYKTSSLREAIYHEAASQAKNYASEDFREFINSIQEKRPPRYSDK